MNLLNKNVLLVGLAKTGISTIKQLDKYGANIIVNDLKNENQFFDVLNELKDLNSVTYIFGHHIDIVDNLDLVVVSPGVPLDLPIFNKIREKNIEIIGEIELAYRLNSEPFFVGITGTNGKTTTTSLVGEIFKASGKDTYIAGNIGNPLIDTIDTSTKDSVIVTELSSFQLESIEYFRPNVSAILNITEDHLNRHHTLLNYIHAKANIFKNQRSKDFCVLNFDDPAIKTLSEEVLATKIFFSRKEELELGVFLDKKGYIVIRLDSEVTLMHKNELSLPGNHNLENALAAIAISYLFNIDLDVIREVLRTFKGVEHRQEFVRTINNITFINDSKATNPDSTIKAIQSYNRPLILIAGGMGKNTDFNELLDIAKKHTKSLILLGETAENIRNLAIKKNFKEVYLVKDMQEAVYTAFKIANLEDIILFSPACASWDMYKNFEARGNDFKYNVNRL